MASDVRLVKRPTRRPPWQVLLLLAGLLRAHAAFAEVTPADRETARTLMEQGDVRVRRKRIRSRAQSLSRGSHDHERAHHGIAVARALAAVGQVVEARDAAMQ